MLNLSRPHFIELLEARKALLTAALARAGLSRDASETLGALSLRIAEADTLDASLKEAVLAALSRYQAWRFGGAAMPPKSWLKFERRRCGSAERAIRSSLDP